MTVSLSLRWKLLWRNRNWRRRGFRLSLEESYLPAYGCYWRVINHVYQDGKWVKMLLGSAAEFENLDEAWNRAKGQAGRIWWPTPPASWEPPKVIAAEPAPPRAYLTVHLHAKGAYYSCKACDWRGRLTPCHPFLSDCPRCQAVMAEGEAHAKTHEQETA